MRSSEIAVEEGVGIGEDDELESVTSELEPGFADLGLARIAVAAAESSWEGSQDAPVS